MTTGLEPSLSLCGDRKNSFNTLMCEHRLNNIIAIKTYKNNKYKIQQRNTERKVNISIYTVSKARALIHS